MSNKFYKTFKPVLCVLRQHGYKLVIFIDDIVIIATSHVRCTHRYRRTRLLTVMYSMTYATRKHEYSKWRLNRSKIIEWYREKPWGKP